MTRIRTLLLLLVAMASSCLAQDRTADPDDVATIDALIKAYYESVSGHPGSRDGARMLSLFIAGGKISVGLAGDEPTHELAEEYLRTERFLTLTEDFFEREISRDTQRFGNMANVISTYGISDAMENTDYTARGVTVFQLVRHNDRWWILSTMWQRESPEFPLPGGTGTAVSDEANAEFVHFQASDAPYETNSDSQRPGYAVLSGDPEAAGIYVIRLRIPPGLPLFRPHFHDQDRFITVISGTWAFGRGDSGKCEDTIPMDPGAYVFHPKGAVHFDGSCVDETVEVQIIGQGPVKTTWVGAAE